MRFIFNNLISNKLSGVNIYYTYQRKYKKIFILVEINSSDFILFNFRNIGILWACKLWEIT